MSVYDSVNVANVNFFEIKKEFGKENSESTI